MPTYEYECQKCRHTFDAVQSIKDEPLKRCPKCKGKIKRLLGTGVGIIFKGSGFYQTDYRSDSYKRAQKADTASGSSSGDSSKPAQKADTSSGESSKPATKDTGSATTKPASGGKTEP